MFFHVIGSYLQYDMVSLWDFLSSPSNLTEIDRNPCPNRIQSYQQSIFKKTAAHHRQLEEKEKKKAMTKATGLKIIFENKAEPLVHVRNNISLY